MARGLNVDRVVAAAIELADEDGLAAVSMARVAERLGFTTMSLYRHVASKEELVWRMLDIALGPAPEFATPDWRTGLERWAHEFRAVLLRHPWGIDIPITGALATVQPGVVAEPRARGAGVDRRCTPASRPISSCC